MTLRLEDDWKEKTSMQQAFQKAMRGPVKNKGNPPVKINIKDLPIGAEVKTESTKPV